MIEIFCLCINKNILQKYTTKIVTHYNYKKPYTTIADKQS